MTPLTDAEKSIRGLCEDVARAPYELAPERKQELDSKIMGQPWELVFCPEVANFYAHPTKKNIEVAYAALLSLWAIAHAALLIGAEAMAATRAGLSTLDTHPGTPIAEACDLIDIARDLIRDPCAPWPPHLPRPDALAPQGSPGGHLNNVFLGATGWMVLHEIAHIHLNHEEFTTAEIRRNQEFEADKWATKWILDQAGSDLNREFRVFAVAIGIVWIGLIDSIRRGATMHPHASDRFMRCSRLFNVTALSPGLELAAYITKAIFDPHATTPSLDTPEDAFNEVLFAYSRLPR